MAIRELNIAEGAGHLMTRMLDEMAVECGVDVTHLVVKGYLAGLATWMEKNVGLEPAWRDFEACAEEFGEQITRNYVSRRARGGRAT